MDELVGWLRMKGQIDFGNLAVGLGTLAVAWVSFKSVRQVGRNELAKARREWIEELRDEISNFCHLHNVLRQRIPSGMKVEKGWGLAATEHGERFDRMHKSFFKIKLLLNAEEQKHSELIECITKMVDSPEQLPTEKLLKLSREIFREEWQATKRSLT